ncbi:MAG: hypothetical protein ND895_27960 [Pyrinomonadaceae bacterium]|nr:hypothetical protein [Pyrinomonadaceae bacterium]
MSETAPHTSLSLKRASLIYLSLALTLTFYHAATIERRFWPERNEFHSGIIRGDFKSPYQYRIVATWLAEAGGWILEKALRLPPGKPSALAREVFYILQRLLATWALFIFFHLYLKSWFSSEIAFSGTLILAGLHLFTYIHYFYQPCSPLNLLFLTIGVYLIRRGKVNGWLYPLTILGSLARETFGLIVPLHVAQFGFNRKSLIHSVALFLIWLAVQLLLRLVFGFRPSFPPRPQILNLYFLLWPIFLFSLFWVIPILYYRHLPPFLRRAMFLFMPPLILANFLFGKVEETRLFLDLSIILIPATLFAVLRPLPAQENSDGVELVQEQQS